MTINTIFAQNKGLHIEWFSTVADILLLAISDGHNIRWWQFSDVGVKIRSWWNRLDVGTLWMCTRILRKTKCRKRLKCRNFSPIFQTSSQQFGLQYRWSGCILAIYCRLQFKATHLRTPWVSLGYSFHKGSRM